MKNSLLKLLTIFLLLSSQAKAVVSSAVGNIAVNTADVSPDNSLKQSAILKSIP
jgi:hypothetical protein